MAYIKADAPTAMLTNNTSTCAKSLTISNVEVLIELFWLMQTKEIQVVPRLACPQNRPRKNLPVTFLSSNSAFSFNFRKKKTSGRMMSNLQRLARGLDEPS